MNGTSTERELDTPVDTPRLITTFKTLNYMDNNEENMQLSSDCPSAR